MTIQHDFWANTSIRELAQAQGVMPVKDIDELRTNAWPGDELEDEFLTTIHRWRKFDLYTREDRPAINGTQGSPASKQRSLKRALAYVVR